jgi:murein DD-endopeptidase MepM/ murein hydrolase activator NlpD
MLVAAVNIAGSLAQQRGCGTYAIRGGDTFWKISQARGVSVQAIQDVNPGVVPEKLQIGQTINLPCAGDGELKCKRC